MVVPLWVRQSKLSLRWLQDMVSRKRANEVAVPRAVGNCQIFAPQPASQQLAIAIGLTLVSLRWHSTLKSVGYTHSVDRRLVKNNHLVCQPRKGLIPKFIDVRDMGHAHTTRIVTVNDCFQSGYRYKLVAPVGKQFDPEFSPELTPAQMLALGVFCGKYMTDCRREFPDVWFVNAKLSPSGPDCSLNYFGVAASQPLAVWRRNGWIHKDDPRGWFQWYCRYYLGRRSEDDTRQIRRWKAMRRHIAQVKRNCELGDLSCRKRQRQALLQWAYDSRNL